MTTSPDYKRGWNDALEMVAKKQDEWAAHCAGRAAEWNEQMRRAASQEAAQRSGEAKTLAATIRTHKIHDTLNY